MTFAAPLLPKSFIFRRIHSLSGLWLVLFLTEHLFTNSQAALLVADKDSGFVQAVNFLKSLPYLPVIEIFLLGVPFLLHGYWGIQYLWTAKSNSFPSDGSAPALRQYSRNRAYTWQRITSWILLFGIIAHVIHMRFLEYPSSVQLGTHYAYPVTLEKDEGLYDLSERLGFKIYNSEQAAEVKRQKIRDEFSLRENQIIAVAPDFGTAELLIVRDTFKSPLMIFLYSVLVIAACFHGFNGLWTFMIRWGITLTARSQFIMHKIAVFFMLLLTFLGLAAVWGSYWINVHL